MDSGTIARVQRGTIYVDDHIDRPLRRAFDSFLNTAVRVVKQGMQLLTEHHAVDIGFLFKKQPAFEAGVNALKKTDPVLAEYLECDSRLVRTVGVVRKRSGAWNRAIAQGRIQERKWKSARMRADG